MMFECRECGGDGWLATSHSFRCYDCNGKGEVTVEKHRSQIYEFLAERPGYKVNYKVFDCGCEFHTTQEAVDKEHRIACRKSLEIRVRMAEYNLKSAQEALAKFDAE